MGLFGKRRGAYKKSGKKLKSSGTTYSFFPGSNPDSTGYWRKTGRTTKGKKGKR